MKILAKKEKENRLLNRKEIFMEIESKTIPDRKKVIDFVSANYNCPKENIIIDKIKSKYGENKIEIIGRIYTDKNDLEKIENKHLLKRIKGEKDGQEKGQEGEKGKETA